MAANPFAKPAGFEIHPETNQPAPATARADIARLAALHVEATETARLANVLGRAPYAAVALAVAAGLAATFSNGDLSQTVAWLVLVLIGVGAMARAYAQAIRAPFERAPLRGFAEDLRAIMLYAGFAWGAGAFLVLPAGAGPAVLPIFAAGMAGVIALILRRPEPALCFVIPAGALCALAALLGGAALTGGMVLAACAVVAGAVYGAGQLSGRPAAFAELGGLQAG